MQRTNTTMQTGDILLFDEKPNNCIRCIDDFIKCFTCSKFSHSALVVVDPPWTKKGIYVWESSYHGTPDPQDGKIKFGVQLQPLSFYTHHYPGKVHIYIRKAPKLVSQRLQLQLTRIHKLVYNKPYDARPDHWIEAWCKCAKRQNNRFFCSAFVTYVLNEVGVMEDNWDNVTAAMLEHIPQCYGNLKILK